MGLPDPSAILVTRRFLHSPALGERTEIEYEVVQQSNGIVTISVTDDLHAALIATPRPVTVVRLSARCSPSCAGVLSGTTWGFQAGEDLSSVSGCTAAGRALGRVRCRAGCAIFPASEQSGDKAALYLMRARQIELQKRRLRLGGMGREFESLRDYQTGDELRNISWTATARRAKLITRQYTTERSQQVWIVLDAGRLSRTAFELRKVGPTAMGESEQERAEKMLLSVTQLDQATTACGDVGTGDWWIGR